MNADKKDNSQLNPFYRNSIYPDAEGIFSFNPKTIDEIKDESIIVLDTNVLLVPYTTGKQSLTEIKRIYKQLVENNRLIVSGQVAREFAEHRVTYLKNLYQQISKGKIAESLGYYPLLEELEEYKAATELREEVKKLVDKYNGSINDLLKQIKEWYWNDPVSKIYKELFSQNVVFDASIDEDEMAKILTRNIEYKIPPGYKDATKPDQGVGDLIIWKTILQIAEKYKTNLIFVSLDQKPDWWIKSEGQSLYFRYELVDEFRRASDGCSIHSLTFSEFLNLFGASTDVVEEVRKEESQNAFEKLGVISLEALMILSLSIERAAYLIIASSGHLKDDPKDFLKRLALLEPMGFTLYKDAEFFWKTRNILIRQNIPNPSQIVDIVGLGVDILNELQKIPHATYTIRYSNIPLYSDRNCENLILDATGVMLEVRAQPGNAFNSLVIHPTRIEHYFKGDKVAREWDLTHGWGETWYRHPETSEISYGWSSSGEFVGRSLDELKRFADQP